MKYLFLPLLFLSPALFAADKSLKTLAEVSKFKETGHYVEAERLCKAFANRFPTQVECVTFGTTPEGRKMRALVIADSKRGLFPGWVKKKKRHVVYFQGGIHAGEIDGKDAGFWLIRQMLEKEANPKLIEALKNVTLVFVPVFNVDGHERFGKNNRPNQVGPEEMGWRTTSQNYNLNRDFAKADSPEMAALHKLIQKWDPVVALDLHVTDGAQFQTEVALVMEPLFHGDKALRDVTSQTQKTLIQRLSSRGHLAVDFYPAFEKDDDPSSGFAFYVAPPRYSQGYWSLLNRMGILVETHSWKNYETRVKVTRDTLEEVILLTAEKGSAWRGIMNEADKKSWVGEKEGVTFEVSEKNHKIDFPGYKYQRDDSEISGKTKITYFPEQP
ncbi:MAG: M14 family zinc carboxypeptidase, partial [Deltaproteobacteria bacterium]